MKREKFILYGHSGGAQFVCRFILFHPEVIDTAAASSAGTFTFPRYDKDYPWGLRMDNLAKEFGQQITAEGLALPRAELDGKINQMLRLKMFLMTGGDETWEDHPDLAWQGKSTLDKTRNYYETLKHEHARRLREGQPVPKEFLWELHILPGVGHDSKASGIKAGELLFGTLTRQADRGTIVIRYDPSAALSKEEGCHEKDQRWHRGRSLVAVRHPRSPPCPGPAGGGSGSAQGRRREQRRLAARDRPRRQHHHHLPAPDRKVGG
jgi:hypothetical protein